MSKTSWGVVVSAAFALVNLAGLPFHLSEDAKQAISVTAFTIFGIACLGWIVAHVEWFSSLRASSTTHPMIYLLVFILSGAVGAVLFSLTKSSEAQTINKKQIALSDMTNSQLRNAAEKYVARLRKFNNEYIRADKSEEDEGFANLTRAIPNDKRQAWDSYIQRGENRRQKYENSFRDNFLTDARMLDEELRKRVDPRALVPGRTGAPMSSDTALLGRLSGPTGMLLNELAIRLETLAKQLPDDD